MSGCFRRQWLFSVLSAASPPADRTEIRRAAAAPELPRIARGAWSRSWRSCRKTLPEGRVLKDLFRWYEPAFKACCD
jgi:hypothetical protein